MIIYNKFFSCAMFCLSFGLFFTENINACFEQEIDGVILTVQEYINEEIPIFEIPLLVKINPHANTQLSKVRAKNIYPLKLVITNKSDNEITLSPQNINLSSASMEDIIDTYEISEFYDLGFYLGFNGLILGWVAFIIALEGDNKIQMFTFSCISTGLIGFSALSFKKSMDKNEEIRGKLEKNTLLAPLSIAPEKTAITFIFADKKDPRLNPFTITFCQKDNSEEKIEFNVIL